MVQLAQERQRCATSSQRGCCKIAHEQRRHVVLRHFAAHVRRRLRDDRLGRCDVRLRSLRVRAVRRARPPPRVTRLRPENHGASPEMTSVSARSKPASTFGPASIETQKQVPPALPQLSATRRRPFASRRDNADRHSRRPSAPCPEWRWRASSQARTPMKANFSLSGAVGLDRHLVSLAARARHRRSDGTDAEISSRIAARPHSRTARRHRARCKRVAARLLFVA